MPLRAVFFNIYSVNVVHVIKRAAQFYKFTVWFMAQKANSHDCDGFSVQFLHQKSLYF